MSAVTDLVFLDTETTGLDPRVHEVWEIAVAINEAPISSYRLPHSLATADPKALEINGYWTRANLPGSTDAYDLELRELLTGATIVGANPAFDTAFLSARWRCTPWHHRLIDVESMALTVLGYERPKGLHGLAGDLRERGHDIPEPDHTAAADVATTRAVYFALRAEADQ
jgi:DNA polymerase III alpha subunit (gram-positive type)